MARTSHIRLTGAGGVLESLESEVGSGEADGSGSGGPGSGKAEGEAEVEETSQDQQKAQKLKVITESDEGDNVGGASFMPAGSPTELDIGS